MLQRVILAVFLLSAVRPAEGQDVREIVERAESLLRGQIHSGYYTLTTERGDSIGILRFQLLSSGRDTSLIRVLEPGPERGITYLRLGNDMWSYLPSIGRAMRFTPSMLAQPWMGSGLTNMEVTGATGLPHGRKHQLVGREDLDGTEAHRIEALPPESSPTDWIEIVKWIRAEDGVPLRIEYRNERGDAVRVTTFSPADRSAGGPIQMTVEVEDLRASGQRSILEADSLLLDIQLPDSIFTLDHLRRPRP